MNHNKDRNVEIFLPVFLTSCFLVFIVLVFSVLLSTRNYEKRVLSASYENLIEGLEKTVNELDLVHKSLRALVIQLYFDSTVSNLRNLREPAPGEVNRAFSKISYAGAVLPYVDSIYIYSPYSKKVYHVIPFGGSREYGLESFPDRVALESLRVSSDNMNFTHREIPLWHNNRKGDSYWGYTFDFSNKGNTGLPDEGGIIINITQDEIIRILETYESFAGTRNYLFKRDGTSQLMGRNDSESRNIFSQFLEKGLSTDGGYYISQRQGEKTLFVYTTYQPFDWIIISAIPYSAVTEEVRKTRWLTFLTGLGTLLVSILLAYFLIKIILKPIEARWKKIKAMEREALQAKMDNKEKYLLSLFRGNDFPDDGLFENHEISLDHDGTFVLVLIIVDSSSAGQEMNRFSEEIIRLSREVGSAEKVIMDDSRIILILENKGFFSETLLPQFRKTAQALLDSTLSLVVSGTVGFDHNLPGAFKMLQQAGHSLFFEGEGSTTFLETWQRKLNKDAPYPTAVEKELCRLVTDEIGNDPMEEFKHFLDCYKTGTALRLKLSLERLCSPLFNRIGLLEKKYGEVFPISFEEIMESIESSRFIGDVDVLFMKLFEELHRFKENHRGNRKIKIVRDVQEIVAKELYNPLLGMEEMGSQLGLSAGYLGRIYKLETGQSLIEHLNNVRVEKAKELLKKEKLSIKEVGAATGYANAQHFHRVFKKNTGLSPSLYRESLRNEGN